MASAQLVQRIRNTPQPSTPVLVCSKLFVCVMPIAEIAMVLYICMSAPGSPTSPTIYLIVLGVFSLMLALLSCLPCARQPEDGTSPNPLSPVCATWNSLASLFLFCWFIAGNVWIYSIYEPNYNKDSVDPGLYCNKNLYLFAFWITTLVYIFLGVAVLGACCTLFCFWLCGRADPDDNV